jgi:hypothetical protein
MTQARGVGMRIDPSVGSFIADHSIAKVWIPTPVLIRQIVPLCSRGSCRFYMVMAWAKRGKAGPHSRLPSHSPASTQVRLPVAWIVQVHIARKSPRQSSAPLYLSKCPVDFTWGGSTRLGIAYAP